MEETTDTGTVLLLERPRTPSEWLRFDLRTDRHSLCPSVAGNGEGCAAVVRRQAPATEPPLHSTPLLWCCWPPFPSWRAMHGWA